MEVNKDTGRYSRRTKGVFQSSPRSSGLLKGTGMKAEAAPTPCRHQPSSFYLQQMRPLIYFLTPADRCMAETFQRRS